jgi:hypothetical protein
MRLLRTAGVGRAANGQICVKWMARRTFRLLCGLVGRSMGLHPPRTRAMHDKDTDYPPIARKPASELAEERREQIAQERRIALWEARHGLALPRSADHPLMQFIADSTDLAVEQVQAEQRRRAHLRDTPNS